MSLPQIMHPKFEIKIPSTKEIFEARPFLVKEEKILIMANSSDDSKEMIRACAQIVTNCTFGKLDASKLSIFDLQHVFLQIKCEASGSKQEFTLTCGACDDTIDYQLDLKSLEIKNLENVNNNKIKADESTVLFLQYPNAMDLVRHDDDESMLVASAIKEIHHDDEVYTLENETIEEILSFIDNLPITALDQIKEFFLNSPYMEHIVEYTCKGCDKNNIVSINGYENFFA
jgi:hypothetical protein